MKTKEENISPPKILEYIISKIYPDKYQYTSIGDFREIFNHIYKEKNLLLANLWYLLQIIKSIPFYLKNNMYWGKTMFINYLRIAFRNTRKNKIFTAINVFGLSVALACVILIYAFVSDELSYNKFHKNHETIYSIFSKA